ncbi:hypothetical protein [Caldimonas brevitalea]|uniref:SH3 domain-containing protein n=1 Tax=Caldimonas brevitalea TaxID=413882 RepID=A0A0G3BSE7_9BURK|nr:hypothetical protein [Caldimonas brevitalea]AKJ30928.1 hypothetical protein AAW51_4237 [Caldimonas brevitalea]
MQRPRRTLGMLLCAAMLSTPMLGCRTHDPRVPPALGQVVAVYATASDVYDVVQGRMGVVPVALAAPAHLEVVAAPDVAEDLAVSVRTAGGVSGWVARDELNPS